MKWCVCLCERERGEGGGGQREREHVFLCVWARFVGVVSFIADVLLNIVPHWLIVLGGVPGL